MKNLNESGRSMVEMLGVLAIVGVLSVGGIAGYTRAMNNWKANEVIDAANRVLVMAETDISVDDGTVAYSDFGGDYTKLAGNIVEKIEAKKKTGKTSVKITWNTGASGTAKVQQAIQEKLGCDDGGSGSNASCKLGPNGGQYDLTFAGAKS